jgi:DNA mismatch repair protein MutL
VERISLPEEPEKVEILTACVPEEEKEPEVALPDELPWHIRGELFHTYIMVEQGESVLLIDKHAAHERMNFDRLRAQGYRPMVQQLLIPLTLRPAPEERDILLEKQTLLEEFGFELEEFGPDALVVRQAPDDVEEKEIESTLLELARRLITTGTADPAGARDELLHTIACKAAIKGGWKSAEEELESVTAAVMSGQVKYCPHGRPVAIEMTRKQLEKQFRRA